MTDRRHFAPLAGILLACLMPTGTWSAPISVNCGSNLGGLHVSFPSPLPDVDIPGLSNVCVDDDFQVIVQAVNTQDQLLSDLSTTSINNAISIDILRSRAYSAQADVLNIRTTLVDHETRITANEAQLDDHEARISANEATIASLSAGVTDLRSDMNAGIAMSNAMEVFLPDPGARFRLNMGMGTHGGMAAIGITGAGRINAQGDAIYLGAAGVPGRGGVSGKAGISFQW